MSKRILKTIVMISAFLWCIAAKVSAVEKTEEVDVTVPTKLAVTFHEDGTTSVSEFKIVNNCSTDIIIEHIYAEEQNGWKLVPWQTSIGADICEIGVSVEGRNLVAGDNLYELVIPGKNEKELGISVKRGAWSSPHYIEGALNLEFEYYLEKSYQVSFDTNGGEVSVDSIVAERGEEILLPNLERDGHEFQGWEDESGKIYVSSYIVSDDVRLSAVWRAYTYQVIYHANNGIGVMENSIHTYDIPQSLNANTFTRDGYEFVGWSVKRTGSEFQYVDKEEVINLTAEDNATITLYARWKKKTAFAIYSSSDGSLSMYKRLAVPEVGEVFNGKEVTAVFTDIESAGSNLFEAYRDEIVSVHVVDVISPVNIASWFYYFNNTSYLDLTNLDTSRVTTMYRTFYYTGNQCENVEIIGLENWDTGKTTNMCLTFGYCGRYSDTVIIGNLSKWNTSSVTDMNSTFYHTAQNASTFILSGLECWDTKNVTEMSWMFYYTGELAEDFQLDLSEWDVTKITSQYAMSDFNSGVEDKVISPKFNVL